MNNHKISLALATHLLLLPLAAEQGGFCYTCTFLQRPPGTDRAFGKEPVDLPREIRIQVRKPHSEDVEPYCVRRLIANGEAHSADLTITVGGECPDTPTYDSRLVLPR